MNIRLRQVFLLPLHINMMKKPSLCDTDLLYSSVKVSQAKQENTQFSLTAWSGCYFSQTTCKCRHEISTALAFFQSVRSAVSGKTVKSCLVVFFSSVHSCSKQLADG